MACEYRDQVFLPLGPDSIIIRNDRHPFSNFDRAGLNKLSRHLHQTEPTTFHRLFGLGILDLPITLVDSRCRLRARRGGKIWMGTKAWDVDVRPSGRIQNG
jgi:hypothetical protein